MVKNGFRVGGYMVEILLALLAIIAGLAGYGWHQRGRAKRAETAEATAKAQAEFIRKRAAAVVKTDRDRKPVDPAKRNDFTGSGP